MMNLSEEKWIDFTWNPITGCKDDCDHCYAARQTLRFSGDIRLNKSSDQLKKDPDGLYILEKPFKNQVTGKVTPHPVGFEPAFHKYRLPMIAQKKKPGKIQVCSLGDLFGPWISDERIEEVFKATDAAPWHAYFFITTYPERYLDLARRGKLRTGKNYWYGTRISRPDDQYFWAGDINTYILIEPVLEDFGEGLHQDRDLLPGPGWIVVGAETGNRRDKPEPKKEWIKSILKSAKETETPVFIKNSLAEIWQEELIQEWPKGLPTNNPVPKCSLCEYYRREPDGKRGYKHICMYSEEKRIPGRYARTSPPWCIKRKTTSRT